MKLKILGVNFANEIFENISFDNRISFTDYDVVIIDPKPILNSWLYKANPHSDGSRWLYTGSDGGLSKSLIKLMAERMEEVRLITEKNQGIVICFLRDKGKELNCAPFQYSKKFSTINIYSWLPPIIYDDFKHSFHLDCYIKKRNAKEFSKIINTRAFGEYIHKLPEENCYEAVLDNQIFSLIGSLEKTIKPIAYNKVGELVAFEIGFGEGKFIFLPPVTKCEDNDQMAGILIGCIKKELNMPELDSSPSWVERYSLPGEKELSEKLKELSRREEELKKEREILKEKVDEFNLLRRLLFGSGKFVLEPAVREAFRILGFAVQKPEDYKEDYDLFAIEDDLWVIGEIEGSKGQIDVWKYRQLLDYVDKATIEGRKCKGLLIGNGFLDQEPSTRQEQFTEKAINGCRSHNFCRITTFELYKAVEKVLSSHDNNDLKEKIKKAIIACTDEFLFDRLDI